MRNNPVMRNRYGSAILAQAAGCFHLSALQQGDQQCLRALRSSSC